MSPELKETGNYRKSDTFEESGGGVRPERVKKFPLFLLVK
jgi:hypothetical protein